MQIVILGESMARIISTDRSIIPACDVTMARYEEILKHTACMPQVGAYKLGASLALSEGLPRLVETARRYTSKPLIYDHQKACTDIPDTGLEFLKTLKRSGVDAIIFFPLSGPATQSSWIAAARDVGLPVIAGGHMTHEMFLLSQGGYIDDSSVEKMYEMSASLGIKDFVVPGNKPSVIANVRRLLAKHGMIPVFYAPGFISQGGKLSDAAVEAGPNWHAIVGRAIYEAKDIHSAVLSICGTAISI